MALRARGRALHTVGEGVGERWRTRAGCLPSLGFPVTPMLPHWHTLAWAVDATDFRLVGVTKVAPHRHHGR